MNLKEVIGFGVAGNFANHLEQAGEIVDFINVKVEEKTAPKGIFPFYVPNSETFLSTFPLSSNEIQMPKIGENLQLEPEIAIFCEIIYENEEVINLIPKKFCAYNDCSIRREGAKKISQKKNWGINSKGYSSNFIEIDKFSKDGILDNYHIASFVKRDGIVNIYGIDSPVLGYNYFYEKLIKWLINKINTQKDEAVLENILDLIKVANYPKETLISIGATAYTSYGESTYLQTKDEIFVIAYNAKIYSEKEIIELISKNDLNKKDNISILHQIVN
jgi:hypothetical protein